jgi:hypothetical protein
MSNESGNKPVSTHKKHLARQQREQQQTRLILYVFFAILGAVILLLAYGWLDGAYLKLNKVVAKVGSAEITVRQFEPRVRLQRQNLLDQFIQYQQYAQFGLDVSAQLQSVQSQLETPTIIGNNVVNLLVDEEIIRQEAEKRGITISEEELTEAMQSGFNYFPNGTQTPTVTPTAFTLPELPADALKILTPTLPASATPEITSTATVQIEAIEATVGEGTATVEPTATFTATVTTAPSATPTVGPTSTPLPTSTPYTEEGYQNTLSEVDTNLAKFGFSESYIRNFFEVQILEKKLRQQILTDVSATETQVRARHILVADEQTAKDLIARLQAGEDFAELALQFSTDTASAVQGGDLGWFGKNQMVAEFEAAAFALEKPGDITLEPVPSSFGYHIIQLVAKQETPLTADQFQQAQDVEFRKWLDAAREEYAVEIFDSVWQQNTPSEPNFITAATEQASAQGTAQAEQLATFQAVTLTPIP